MQRSEKRSSFLDNSIFSLIPWNWETGIFLVILLGAALLRFWDLGSRALHHDESIHAVYSWYILSGQGIYRHDPTYHGPFLYYSEALTFFLFGASDYATRIMPAIFGTLLVAAPLFLKRYLRRLGVLAVALMTAISPSILYYSRALRHDIFSLAGTAFLFIAIFRFMEERRLRWVYLGAVAYAIGYANHELMVLATTPIFFLGLVGILVWENVLSKGDRPLTEALRSVPGQVWVNCLLIFLAVYMPLFTSLFTNMAGLYTGSLGISYWFTQHGVQRGSQPIYYYAILVPLEEFLPLLLALCGAVMALRQVAVPNQPRSEGAGSKPRSETEWRYGSVASILDTYFPIFVLYWGIMAFLGYSYAGEKMPWLTIHITYPLILLGGWFLGRFLEDVAWADLCQRGGLVLGVAMIIVALALVRWSGLRPSLGGVPLAQQQATMDWLALTILLALGIGAIVWAGMRLGLRASLQVIWLLLLIVLVIFTFHTGIMVSFLLGDVPKDPLIYVQSTPDVTNVRNKIDNLSQRLTSGKDLVIYYDDETSWPFIWYLKDYPRAVFQPKGPTTPPDVPVVLVGLVNDDKVRPLMSKYTRTHLKMRSWFPEEMYRTLTWEAIPKTIADPIMRQRFWEFLILRKLYDPAGNEITAGRLGSTDFVVYVRKDLADSFWGSAMLPGKEVKPAEDLYSAKQRLVAATMIFGVKGSGDGQFLEPKGVAVDAAGNIYVADTLNHRIQKFDPQGKFLLKWGSKGEGDGQFNEPWGIAVDRAGNVYVADTWNHRIQKFDSDGRFLAKWGTFADTRGLPDATPAVFYGPRAIAIDKDGNLWVADTGNKRLQKFAADGRYLAQFGSAGTEEGHFNEPVGVAIDPAGNIYVADTWNRRIQKFSASLSLVAIWPIAGWESESVLNKPYLAADADGVYASDPEMHRVIRFSPTGSVLAVIGRPGADAVSFNLPVGLALDAAGNLYVADAFNNRIMKFAPVK